MEKNVRFVSFALTLLVFGALTSCKKDQEEVKPSFQQDSEAASATLEVVAEVEALNTMVLSLSEQNNSAGGRRAAIQETDCGIITYQVDNSTHFGTITVDYGSGQQCPGEGLRKGKIIFTFSAAASEGGFWDIAAQFVGYEADGKKLDGKYTVNVSYDQAAQSFNYLYTFKDAVLTYQDGSKVSWTSRYEWKLKIVAGKKEGDMPVANVELTGGLSGTSRQGKTFSADITSPLIVDSACEWGVTKGLYLIKSQGHSEATYDFGNGACDNVATLTINGQTQQFSVVD
ncbi:MAG: hypothetical protein H7Z75_21470 [Ferruginibacter sp.]|nr:hypothetical protein [Cytophagales bacterium]